MEKTLLVKCPDCKKFNDLGIEANKVYKSSIAFLLNRKCVHCGLIFDETDTHEADYKEIEQPLKDGTCKYKTSDLIKHFQYSLEIYGDLPVQLCTSGKDGEDKTQTDIYFGTAIDEAFILADSPFGIQIGKT